MLIFTNRVMKPNATNESAFTTSYTQGTERLGMATVEKPGAKWVVSALDEDVSRDDAKKAMEPLFDGPRPMLVYIHGNNNTPLKCFERCAKLASLYKVEVIGFSWPSEGYLPDGTLYPDVDSHEVDGDEEELTKVRKDNRNESKILSKIYRYHQATINARHAADSLARFMRLVAAVRIDANKQPFSVAAHSLGAQFLQYTLDMPGFVNSIGAAQNVALLAPCVRAEGHAAWLQKIKPQGQLFVTFNKADSVLAAASIADNGLTGDTQMKLGTDPTSALFRAQYMRYISCSNTQAGFGAHGYFVQNKMPKKMGNVFGRIFNSRRDLEPGEYERDIYGIKGAEDGSVFYFNA